MCTLIVLHQCVAGSPLVVAANRDEFLNRPAEDFALRDCDAGSAAASSSIGPILCPLDREAGGTWVGLNQRGVFAGLTNLRPESEETESDSFSAEDLVRPVADPAANLKSRGGVVMSALEASSAQEAITRLSGLEESAYNPFQLLVADGQDAFLIVYRDRPNVKRLEPGAHVVGNVEDDFQNQHEEPRALKLTRIRASVEKLVTEPRRDLFEGLARICREHVVDGHQDDGSEDTHGEEKGAASPFESTCVHFADRYGTRSSLLLELSEDPKASRLWTTNGPPCERPFDNRSSLLSDLGVRLGS